MSVDRINFLHAWPHPVPSGNFSCPNPRPGHTESRKFGYVDVTTGKEITAFKYGRAWPFNGCCAEVELNGKWGSVDKEGKEKF